MDQNIVSLMVSQRLHFDIYGYVLLKNVLTLGEVERMKSALYRADKDPNLDVDSRVYANRNGDHYVLLDNLVEYDSALLEYAVHPKLVPLVEEVVGGKVRLEETEAIINSRDPDADLRELEKRCYNPIGFHRGTQHGWGTYIEQNKFHCVFVKTLAYLTDVGPDDGGTAFIPGSHRLTWDRSEIIEAAMSDDSLVCQVEAEAGDVLLFPESLIHSTTAITSDKERTILIAGYTPTMFQPWPGNEVDPEFVKTLPDEMRALISGSESWSWQRKY
ncbi:MAG: phytanoyl-CoA dioxygenase family protein [Candidatus Poribacteria bacterium]|nr:phytanoyl-CoA dioxygenase family protein [Candidatus Poribacteria bacterium]